ncbi:MAG: RluA family pseudouridine synthase [Firmicutes bacterium]|nr:RluA family pseudouridine synthase [[Eubacterium] siraeum]MCM1487889.1 RluA family pseudouridine synthase [Bacillota bacterium]
MKKEILIGENDGGQRLDRFLTKAFPALKSGMINKAVRNKDIRLNGKRTEANVKLKKDDRVYVYFPDRLLDKKPVYDDFRSAENHLSVIYEDENILLVDKEQGLVVHADNDGTVDTLINRIKKYLCLKGEYIPENERSFAPSLCNRIDRNTCGIVIAAKNAEALRIMSEKIKNRELSKKYICISLGELPKKEDTLTAYLQKDTLKNTVTVSDKKTSENLTIKTSYRVLESCGELSLIEIDLLTGRTHQIRAHLAHIGHPLLGDGKYGINKINRKYGFTVQALCSYRLTFDFKTDGGILNYLDKKSFRVKEIPFIEKYNQIKEQARKKD